MDSSRRPSELAKRRLYASNMAPRRGKFRRWPSLVFKTRISRETQTRSDTYQTRFPTVNAWNRDSSCLDVCTMAEAVNATLVNMKVHSAPAASCQDLSTSKTKIIERKLDHIQLEWTLIAHQGRSSADRTTVSLQFH